MSRLRFTGVLLLIAVLTFGAVAATPTAATDHQSETPGAAQLGDAGIEPDGVLLRADLRADGDAGWTVEYRVRLNDENTTAAFESLRDDIEANETAYTSTFADRMRATVRAAENTTGREMGVQNVSVRATRQQLPQEYGVVTYRFEWTGFGVANAETLEAGDALAGLFLDRQTTFVVAWPESYTATAVQPTPDERRDDAVVWVGPRDFGDGEPAVSVSTTATETVLDGGGNEGEREQDGGTGGTEDGGDAAGGGSSLPLVAGAALLVAVGVAAVALWRRSVRNEDEATAGGRAGATNNGTADEPSTAETAGVDDPDVPGDSAGEATEDGSATPEDDTPTAAEGDTGVAPWEDELLSNEERVVALLEHNDGRMKQQAIAAELDWSDAKTSQVIGKLRDAEEIETFRLGRENVVSLPGSGLS